MKSQREKAEAFRALHHGKRMLVLPNAWDVPSARVFEDEGFPAVATSSAGMFVSLGYPDGQEIPRRELIGAVRRITRVLSIPVSADVVAEFGDSPGQVASTITAVIGTGAVRVNIEDFTHATKELYTVESQVSRLKAIRRAGRASDVPVVMNARTDALRYAKGDERARLEEAIEGSTSSSSRCSH